MKFLDASWENGNDELNSSSAHVKSSDSELIALHFTFLLYIPVFQYYSVVNHFRLQLVPLDDTSNYVSWIDDHVEEMGV